MFLALIAAAALPLPRVRQTVLLRSLLQRLAAPVGSGT
jgi:hypothetical protein